MFTVICDNCGADANSNCEYSCWNDKDIAIEMAKECNWIEEKDKHYCDNCWGYDDNDNIVLRKFP